MCDWKNGGEIHFRLEDNYYWVSFLDIGESIELQGEKRDVYKMARTAIETYFYSPKSFTKVENRLVVFG
mgnify:CR=1 FL=1